ncbi:MAG: outer membrane beta-barrel protein [Acidobacteriota bacterium]|jgi:opacity protein-like surface antigen
MKRQSRLFFFALASVLLCGATGAWAENTKGRWDIGGGFYFVSTVDDIRNNAAFVLFDQPGPDGIPNTGDETILFADPRPDDLITRETTLQEGVAFNVNFSYGVTDWLALQIDVGHYDANVVQLDTWVHQEGFFDANDDQLWDRAEGGQSRSGACVPPACFEQSQPFAAGSVTQIPISLNFVFRFRKDSPLNPYVGVGAGYVLLDSSVSGRLDQVNEVLSGEAYPQGSRCSDLGLEPGCKIATVGTNNYFPTYEVCQRETCPTFQDFTVDVEDAVQYNLMAGVEYFFNSKVSMYFDARYNFLNTSVNLKSPAYSSYEQLHFNFASVADTLPYCGDAMFDDFGFPPQFSRNDQGLPDVCRPGTPAEPGELEIDRLTDELLIQGGTIDLSNYTLGVGVRFYF